MEYQIDVTYWLQGPRGKSIPKSKCTALGESSRAIWPLSVLLYCSIYTHFQITSQKAHACTISEVPIDQIETHIIVREQWQSECWTVRNISSCRRETKPPTLLWPDHLNRGQGCRGAQSLKKTPPPKWWLVTWALSYDNTEDTLNCLMAVYNTYTSGADLNGSPCCFWYSAINIISLEKKAFCLK